MDYVGENYIFFCATNNNLAERKRDLSLQALKKDDLQPPLPTKRISSNCHLLFLLDFDQSYRFYDAIWTTIFQDFENIRRHSRVILFFSKCG